MSPQRDGDVVLVRRAARRLGVQAAALVALTVLIMTALGAGLVIAAQNRSAEDLLRQAAVTADDASDPPAGVWLVLRDPDNGLRVTARMPRGLPDTAAMDAVGRTGRARVRLVDVGRTEYLVRTIRRDGTTVQAILDLTPQHRQRTALARILAVVGALGLALSAAAGTLLARRAVRPLSDALALQRAFIADASHELRTPLTLLATRAQMLRRSLVSRRADPAVLGDANGVVTDVARMTDLVEELLTAADPGTDWERRSVDLAALCAELRDSAQEHARSRGVAVVVEHRGDADVRTHGNDVALRRAVLALVDNAIEHTPPGGTVGLMASTRAGSAVLEVRDTGTGISPGEAHRIFDRFRSGSQKANRRSYGLGLALARDVVTRHGGRLTLEHTSAHGTCFRVELPGA